MKRTRWKQILVIASCALTLSACHHKRPNTMGYENGDGYLSHRGANSSGIGQESSFGDQGPGRIQMVSKRIYYFAFDSNVVREVDYPAINANADFLRANRSAKVLLEGHTDPRGSREYNIGLGERRAKAVADILVSRGVSPEQIRIVSYGAEKLATPGHTESAFQMDRRVVLAYLRK